MSYQVLARKWRPRTFREMVGQEHVLQALINALDRDRLHHAYLFSGTRGVGKTTIARILARCLNCETGVSSEPCGQCSSCVEINEGRFIDLLEVDAASRTKVEDTRELLENVHYAPSRGRYKVYLIDEVHMLSGHSFNALLKTLEEPPPHVKFLLATTDPQKLPATVLSRCLQFNLKNLTPERIVEHLRYVLEQEMVEAEPAALQQLALAAEGSMRDALSLADQAIAFGGGKVLAAEVASMLGTVDRGSVMQLLVELAAGNGAGVFAQLAHLAEFGADFQSVLDELLSLLHALAVQQVVPGRAEFNLYDGARLAELATTIPAEELQLYYQVALNSRRDLPFVPDPRSGVEMAFVRMLSFRPLAIPEWVDAGEVRTGAGSSTLGQAAAAEAADPVKKPEAGPVGLVQTAVVHLELARPVTVKPLPVIEPPRQALKLVAARVPALNPADVAKAAEQMVPPLPTTSATLPVPPPLHAATWAQNFPGLPLNGIVQNIAANCVLVAVSGYHLQFVLDQDKATLYNDAYRRRLQDALSEIYACRFECQIDVGRVDSETPAVYAARKKEEQRLLAIVQLQQDSNICLLLEQFDGELELESVQPM